MKKLTILTLAIMMSFSVGSASANIAPPDFDMDLGICTTETITTTGGIYGPPATTLVNPLDPTGALHICQTAYERAEEQCSGRLSNCREKIETIEDMSMNTIYENCELTCDCVTCEADTDNLR